MPHSVVEQFRELQLLQLIDEARSQKDRVAFIPVIEGGLEPSPSDVYSAFVSAAGNCGYKTYGLSDKFGSDVVVLEDDAGRPSIWVDRHLAQGKCRAAFLEFINQYSNAPRLDAIGKDFHVDHAFNKARVTNASHEIGDDAAINGNRISMGYLRLFLIKGSINTGYGASIEKLRSNERLEVSGFRMASWMVLLKLCEIPKPVTDSDFLVATLKLQQHLGQFPFLSAEDFVDALKFELRLAADRWTIVIGNRVAAVEREDFEIMLNTHWFQRSRLARLIHEFFGWKIYNLSREGGGEEFGIRIADTDRYYVADLPPRVVNRPEVLRESAENHIGASEDIKARYENQEIYLNLVSKCEDEVAQLIKSEEGWDGRVLAILSGDR